MGSNGDGELGQGDYTDRSSPTLVLYPYGTNPPSSSAASARYERIACGNRATIAVRRTGEVLAFGRNRYGSLGLLDGDSSAVTLAISGVADAPPPIDEKVIAFSPGSTSASPPARRASPTRSRGLGTSQPPTSTRRSARRCRRATR